MPWYLSEYFHFFIIPVIFVFPDAAAGTGGLVGLAGADGIPVAGADDVLLLYLGDLHGRFHVCSFHNRTLLLFNHNLLAIFYIHAALGGLAAQLPTLKVIPLPSIQGGVGGGSDSRRPNHRLYCVHPPDSYLSRILLIRKSRFW